MLTTCRRLLVRVFSSDPPPLDEAVVFGLSYGVVLSALLRGVATRDDFDFWSRIPFGGLIDLVLVLLAIVIAAFLVSTVPVLLYRAAKVAATHLRSRVRRSPS